MTTTDHQPAIRCQSLYKVFGLDAGELAKFNPGALDQAYLDANGLVAAVNDVTLDVFPGEILVVMGLSGSGKSTLVRCLSRLIEATSGRVEIEGRDLLAMSERELVELRRNKMGMVFQNFALLPHKTVFENIVFPLQMRGMKRADYMERGNALIELVGLAGKENSFPRELSGGQQQRVGIARSLAAEPDIWFLDEPFSALDPLIRREMQDEFLRLQALLHKTIIFITHDFDEALRLADRIAIMFNGRIEQIGTPAEIVLHSATDYVAKFTNEVPREKVLTAGSVMDAIREGDDDSAEPVSVDDRIDGIANYILGLDKPVPVVDGQGRRVGMLHRDRVLDILFPDAAGS
jgi:glycine betaine/proline transport system ATP-binding protein